MSLSRIKAKLFFSIAGYLTLVSNTNAGKILVIPAMVSPSHKMGVVPLSDALAERGHNVLFWAAIAADDKYLPKKAAWKQVKGVTDNVWLNEMYVYKNDSSLFSMHWTLDYNIPGIESALTYLIVPYCEDILANKTKEITDVLAQKWDLIIMDEMFNPCGFLLAQLIGAPVATYVSTSCLTRHSAYRNGQPAPRSYVPNCSIVDGYTDRMTFRQRVHNFLLWVIGYFVDLFSFMLVSRRLAKYYPEVTDLTAPVTLPDLTFSYFSYKVDYPAPLNPNLIHVGGLHVSKATLKPLPANVQDAVDAGNKGFILVSTGHWARFEYASPETKKAFIDAFNKIAADGVAVIWQYSGDALAGIRVGVTRFDWLPQRELLAHPKCLGFVSHCGCNSALEAIEAGVPIISLGLFADQISGAALLETKGMSKRLNKLSLTRDIIYDAVHEVVTNKSIQAKAKMYSNIFKDEPMPVMDRAVFWSEYVMRHKGGKWLKTRLPIGLNSILKYYCLDVIPMILAASSLIAFSLFKTIVFFWRLMIRGRW